MKIIRRKMLILVSLFCIIMNGCYLYVEASEYGEDANAYKKQISQLYEAEGTEKEQIEQIQNYLMDRIVYMGYRPIEYPIAKKENNVEEGKNIVFQRRGKSDEVIILEACYKNNSLGVGMLLEMANQLAPQKELPYSVRFLLTDEEETWGTVQYLNQLTEKEDIIAAVSLDTKEGQSGIQMQVTETAQYQWLGEQIQSIAEQMGISIPTAVKLPSIWEQSQIPQVSITVSDTYTQLRNAAMLLDVWIGNASKEDHTVTISKDYQNKHGIETSASELIFYGVPVQKMIEMIVIIACSACLIVFFFQFECSRRRRRRRGER